MRQVKQNLKTGLALLAASSFLACTEGSLETSRLNELKPIMFGGELSGTAKTSSTSSFFLQSTSCDKTTSDIQFATSETGPYSSLTTLSSLSVSQIIEGCRQSGVLQLDVLAAKILSFIKGQEATKKYFSKQSAEKRFPRSAQWISPTCQAQAPRPSRA